MAQRFSPRLLVLIVSLSMIFGAIGCSRQPYPKSNYGESHLTDARFSPDGISVFRAFCDETDRRSIDVRSLSPKTGSKINSLVWVPHDFEAHNEDVLKWSEDWLSMGGKTLIYVGRDHSPTRTYWQLSGIEMRKNSVLAKDIENCQLNAAFELAELNRLQMRVRQMVVLPWGVHHIVRTPWKTCNQPTGEFSSAIAAGEKGQWEVRSSFEGWDLVDIDQTIRTLNWKGSAKSLALVPPAGARPVNPRIPIATFPVPVPNNASKTGDIWVASDDQFLSQAQKAKDWTDYTSDVLLATEDGTPLITRVQRDKWIGSQVYLIANSCLISNLSMTFRANREVAKRLISDLPQGKVGYLSQSTDPRVFEGSESEQQKGFEALTMWPLNVITIHASFMGIVVLLALFPIFGRPKKLPQLSTQNFAQHIEAMGALLYKSRDRFYALATIADYFRTVRRDPKSEWANCEPEGTATPNSPFGDPVSRPSSSPSS